MSKIWENPILFAVIFIIMCYRFHYTLWKSNSRALFILIKLVHIYYLFSRLVFM